MQRRGSVSSNGSAPTRPGLQRRDSSGSMTERTFRDPSPNRPERPASSHGPYPKYDKEDAPPVPALPQRYNSPTPTGPSSSARSMSVETKPTRRSASGAVKLHRTSASVLSTPASKQSANSPQTNNAAHQAATKANVRSSVNFSRPMSPQLSPTPSPLTSSRSEPDDNLVARLRARSPNANDESTQSAPTTPANRKKKKATGGHPSVKKSDDLELDSPPSTINREGPQTKPRQLKANDEAGVVDTDRERTESSAPGLQVTEKKKKKKKPVQDSSTILREADDNFGNAYPSDTDSAISDLSTTTDQGRILGPRARGVLAKQPSIVREDPEGEEKDELRYGTGKLISTSERTQEAAKATVKSSGGQKPRRKNQSSQKVEAERSLQAKSEKSASKSLSPARAAHFSAQPMYESPDALKHQPLGRSASPAKSAMKQSPSRGPSPALIRTKGLASGNNSDAGSGPSDDGGYTSKKKKSIRVSFDDSSVVVGQAATPVDNGSPILLSPQDTSRTNQRLKHVGNTELSQSESDQDQDTAIKPTPTLPSFGSIRNKKASGSRLKEQQDYSQEQIDSAHATEIGASTDQNVGKVLSSIDKSDDATKISGTSKEDDTLSSVNDDEDLVVGSEKDTLIETRQNANQPDIRDELHSRTQMPEQVDSKPDSIGLPSIAVLPATPAADESRINNNEWLEMPGGFSASSGITETEAASSTGPEGRSKRGGPTADGSIADSVPERSSPVITPASAGIAEPELDVVAAQHELGAPHVGDVAGAIRTQIDAQDNDIAADDASLYSDAEEEHVESEGDGFGSINAIVESPALEPSQPADDAPAADLDDADGARGKSHGQDSNMGKAQSPSRSSLTRFTRLQLEQAALPGAADEPIIRDRTLRGENSVARKPKKKAPKQDAAATDHSPSPLSSQGSKNQATSKATGTMRTIPQPSNPISTGEPIKAAAKPQNPPIEPKGVLQKRYRPISATAASGNGALSSNRAPNHTRVLSENSALGSSGAMAAPVKKKGTKPILNRTKSNGSDSDSSFKRIRASAPNTGKYQMRRSMRGSSRDAESGPAQNRNSSHPAGTHAASGSVGRRPFSSTTPGGTGMRMSMREPIDSTKSDRKSLRLSMDSSRSNRTKSPSRISFGLGHKKTPTKAKSSYSSRFGDSSDEEGTLPVMKSRFEDSSDDEPTRLAPVRGIPRQIDEGSSTDLEDSSINDAHVPNSGKSNDTQPTTVSTPSTKRGEHAPSASTAGTATKLGNVAPNEGSTTPSASIGGQDKKKRSYFGTFRAKKKSDAQIPGSSGDFSQPAQESQEVTDSLDTSATSAAAASAASPAEKEKAVHATQKAPKLQRRFTPTSFRKAKDISWPLKPDGTPQDDPDRPQTSDGPQSATTTERPQIGNRRITLQSAPDPSAIENAGKKKKRFPMLRKAFGLK